MVLPEQAKKSGLCWLDMNEQYGKETATTSKNIIQPFSNFKRKKPGLPRDKNPRDGFFNRFYRIRNLSESFDKMWGFQATLVLLALIPGASAKVK